MLNKRIAKAAQLARRLEERANGIRFPDLSTLRHLQQAIADINGQFAHQSQAYASLASERALMVKGSAQTVLKVAPAFWTDVMGLASRIQSSQKLYHRVDYFAINRSVLCCRQLAQTMMLLHSKQYLLILSCLLGFIAPGRAQQTENVVLVTLDGVRWQEVFTGADSTLLFDPAFSPDTAAARKQFWASMPSERRAKLMPFCWTTLVQQGQLYGNRLRNNRVNVANPYWFSYPSYSELLTGYADERINSNDKKVNPNTTVLEFLNKQPGFQHQIAVFSSWDVIEAVVNEPRSGIYANSANEPLPASRLETDSLLNDMMIRLPSQFAGVRQDFLTYYAAKSYVRQHQPRVLFVSFDETDDLAHAGKYADHLRQLQAIDSFLADLWKTLQRMPQYAGKTTLLVTTDHGRGHTPKARWKDHGTKTADSYQIWLAAMGPGTPATGEQAGGDVLFQQQIAATIARLLGYDFRAEHPVAPAIPNVFR